MRFCLSAIPEEMRAYHQWVCWKLVDKGRKNADGSSRLEKLPFSPTSGAAASSTDPDTWGTYEEACKASDRYNGIGFVFTNADPYTGVDFDKVLESDGQLSTWARKIVDRLDSYTEFSVSGHGLHTIVNAAKARPRCRKGQLEAYDSGRFFTMTGDHLPGTPEHIESRQAELDSVLLEAFGANVQESRREPSPATEWSLSDSDLLTRAMSSKSADKFSRLWQGDTTGYDSRSEAEAALCAILSFWTGKDASRIDRLFRQSGLYREKWERLDYRTATIQGAIALTTETYRPGECRTTVVERGSDPLPRADFALTDLGNAERLIAAHGQNLRHDVNRGAWLVWNGKRWEYDTTGEVNRLALKVIRGIYAELQDAEAGRAKDLLSHIKKSEAAPRFAAMVDVARILPGVPVQASELNHDPWLLNCLNGTVDLRSGDLKPHTREDLITRLAPVEYDPTSTCPRWRQFLSEVFQGDAEVTAFVNRMAGYLLTGDTREESVFILTGKGANGKSKMVETLRAVLGDYAGDTPFSTFMERRDSNTADLAALMGKRLVTASEGEEAQSFNESLLKQVSGGDPVTCRYLYRDFFSYQPSYKIVFTTNGVPGIRSQNCAMKRRIKLVPFRQRFYDPEDGKQPVKDDQLKAKLLAERNGILAWMVAGCLEWRRLGLATPATIRAEVDRLFESQDPLAEFIEAECDVRPGAEVEVGLLWKRYQLWCDDTGRKPAFKQPHFFSRSLTHRDGIDPRRGTGGVRMITGLGLNSDASDAEMDFSQTSPMKGLHSRVSEHTESASLSVTNEREYSGEDPFDNPADDCDDIEYPFDEED